MSSNSLVKKTSNEKLSSAKKMRDGRRDGRVGGQDGQYKIPEDSLVAAANKGAKIKFNKNALTTALQTNFLEVREIVMNDLIERFPLVAPRLHPNYVPADDGLPTINAVQQQYKELYLQRARETWREQSKLWEEVKKRRTDRGLPVTRKIDAVRALKTWRSSSSAEPPPTEPDLFDDFNIEEEFDEEDVVDEDQSSLLFDPTKRLSRDGRCHTGSNRVYAQKTFRVRFRTRFVEGKQGKQVVYAQEFLI